MLKIIITVYALSVTGLVAAELKSARNGQIIFKILAALGFCTIAVASGALSTSYGQITFAALIACAAGDICLLSRSKPMLFKLGMAAFALGHVIYIFAFAALGSLAMPPPFFLLGLAVFGIFMVRYLWPHLPVDMRVPVLIYNAIILATVMAALGSSQKILILAAILFAISDVFVGRDRFVSPSPANALVISPLYFGAQLLFALSAAQS